MRIALYQGLCVRFRPCQFYYVIYYVIRLFYTDIYTFRRLGLNLTCDPAYQTHKLYHK